MRKTLAGSMRALLALLTSLILLTVAACGDDSDTSEGEGDPGESIAVNDFPATDGDLPFELPDSDTPAAQIDYDSSPATLTLITRGSSTCPEYPANITWSNATTVALTTGADYGDAPCTADLVPHAHVVELPPNQEGGEVESVVLDGAEIEFSTT